MTTTLAARALALVLAAGLAGCTTVPRLPAATTLLQDELFPAAPPAFDTGSVFAVSDAMRAYAEQHIVRKAAGRDLRRTLIDALYAKDRLRLDYDGELTLSASQAFDAKAGNCMSLVVMTAAFARHLGLPVSFQRVAVQSQFRREHGLTLESQHVNLVLSSQPTLQRLAGHSPNTDDLVVDFLLPTESRYTRTSSLTEPTVLAMFLNNRAAEALGRGELDLAYAQVRDALRQDPGFVPAVNTLGVIYQRAGHLPQAEAALRHAAAASPEDATPLSNLVSLLRRSGRGEQADVLQVDLDRLQPQPPFQHFDRGRAAMAEGRYHDAAEDFARELRLQPYQHEVHFWAAQAHWQLGDAEGALRHLQQARDHSDSRASQARFASKLEHLRAHLSR